jgi:hypothetical protein
MFYENNLLFYLGTTKILENNQELKGLQSENYKPRMRCGCKLKNTKIDQVKSIELSITKVEG